MSTQPSTTAPPAGLSTPVLIGVSLLLVAMWGTSFNIISVVVRTLSPIWLVTGRIIIGAIMVIAWSHYRGHRFPALNDSRWLWYIGLGGIGMVAPFYLISRGQIHVDSGLTAILVGTMPLITIVLAHFFVGERLNLRKASGFLLGFTGTVILFLPDDLSLSLVTDWRAQGLLIGGALLYAITTILAKLAPETPSSLGAAMMLTGASVMSLSLALIEGIPQTPQPPLSLALLVILGVGSTGLGNILYLYIIRKAGPTALAKINYFPPVLAVAVGIGVMGEPFSWKLILGFGIILTGLFIARNRTARRLPKGF